MSNTSSKPPTLARRASRLLGVAIALCLILGACSGAREDAVVVEVFGTYTGVEADRFADSMRPFEERTGIDVRYIGAGAFGPELIDRAREGDLPDIALFPQPGLLADLTREGKVISLGAQTAAAVDREYPVGMRSVAEVDGQLVGVPYRISINSLVWYPSSAFAALGYEVPDTWDELESLSSSMKADGFHPWCLGVESFAATGWVSTDWIEDLMLRLHGPEVYDSWVRGEVRFDDERVAEAFEVFSSIVHSVGSGLGGTRAILATPWNRAGDPLFHDQPACLLHRQGSFYESQLPDPDAVGETIDVFLLPSMSGEAAPILIAGEVAGAFADTTEVEALMAYLASPEAGEAWAQAGGFISPNLAFDDSVYPSDFERNLARLYEEAPVVRFDGSDQMPSAVGTGTFWDGMNEFVVTGDFDTAVSTIIAGFDQP